MVFVVWKSTHKIGRGGGGREGGSVKGDRWWRDERIFCEFFGFVFFSGWPVKLKLACKLLLFGGVSLSGVVLSPTKYKKIFFLIFFFFFFFFFFLFYVFITVILFYSFRFLIFAFCFLFIFLFLFFFLKFLLHFMFCFIVFSFSSHKTIKKNLSKITTPKKQKQKQKQKQKESNNAHIPQTLNPPLRGKSTNQKRADSKDRTRPPLLKNKQF